MPQTPKINYQLALDKTLSEITAANTRPSLLLHSCCAPCSSYVLEYLTKYFDITVYYYNPNISPEKEYTHRVDEIRRLISEMCPSVSFIEGKYEPERFYEMAKGLESEPERGARCLKCYRMRLEESAKAALSLGSDYFTTTLSISPQKDSAVLNVIGAELSEKYNIPYLYSDFKKRGGYKRSIELSAEFGLYRQNFCGCIFSKAEAERRNQKT
ncbi:MAG: epoxyqueuosine reductase QueH [Clostridia bacterium]|nr:epoxyqueuosine reductase QueH [Clostridia bacterium]MBR2176361.1 epoxyqueuosine reductase QueH [Clostridia bacterium]